VTRFAHRMARRMDPILQFGSPVRTEELVLHRIRATRVSEVNWRAGWKRAIDVALSVVALVVLSPLMLLVAALIKVTSPGPVFFRQERIGVNRRTDDRRGPEFPLGAERRRSERRDRLSYGKPFTIFKFRTMHVGAEADRPLWATKGDPRITTLGRMLRLSRIDEIPQFINVLQGDMSVVGPRPEREFFMSRVAENLPDFELRLRTKPGITGLAQVMLGYTNTDEGLRHKLHLDLQYIRDLSPWNDLKILFRTIFVVVTGKGAC